MPQVKYVERTVEVEVPKHVCVRMITRIQKSV